MKKIILTTFFLTTFIVNIFAQEKIGKPKLKILIDSLFNVDQQVQLDFIEVLQNRVSSDSIKLFSDRKNQTYARHIPIIKKVVSTFGYPSFEKVGKETSSNFFTLIQHSDIDLTFQTKMLALIKKQVDKKQVSGNNYAFLYDRVQKNSKKEQLYGTQLGYDENGNAYSVNLKDKENVNRRRKDLGMETLEEYLKKATEVHKKQNQKK